MSKAFITARQMGKTEVNRLIMEGNKMGGSFGDGSGDEPMREYTKKQHYLEICSDDEILLEARRRGLFMRIEAQSIARADQIENGYDKSLQMQRTFATLVGALARECEANGVRPMGTKFSYGHFGGLHPSWSSEFGSPWAKERRLTIPLNFVIEKVQK